MRPLKPRCLRARAISIAPERAAARSTSPRILAMPEMLLGALLVAGAATIYAVNIYRHIEADLFATILLLQSLPFLSAVALVWLERLSGNQSRKAPGIQPAT